MNWKELHILSPLMNDQQQPEVMDNKPVFSKNAKIRDINLDHFLEIQEEDAFRVTDKGIQKEKVIIMQTALGNQMFVSGCKYEIMGMNPPAERKKAKIKKAQSKKAKKPAAKKKGKK